MIVSTPKGHVQGGSAVSNMPIYPHSFSFQPVVVYSGVKFKIMLLPEARNTMWYKRSRKSAMETASAASTATSSPHLHASPCE